MEFESSTDEEFGLNVLASTLAHEIRNPLQAMRLQLDLARRDGSKTDALEGINRGLDRLESVVQRIQRLGKKYQLDVDLVDLSELVESSLSSVRFWLTASGIQVSEKVHWEGRPLISADRELLEQVLLNLIMNSVHAMPQGGELSVRISECEHSAEIEVIDSGEGMNESTLKAAGTPFFTTKEKGSGLGLAFCKSIVALHGGSLEIESALDRGTRIKICLPKEQAK
jgi:two-component system, sporulation sensor kinase E